jgi:predicted nucleic acid-binding protein
VALPKTYLETSVISYLTARPSRDLVITVHQDLTRRWWETRRQELDLYVSSEVMNEIGRGDPDMARQRLQLVAGLPILDADPRSEELAIEILRASALPMTASADAVHIAIATIREMDFLVTWNCRHIANGFVQRRIARLVRAKGLQPLVVVTPEELMEGDYVGRRPDPC